MTNIYLDYNASTPIDPKVSAVMRPLLGDLFGNPSSDHWASHPAAGALFRARAQVATLLGASPGEIVFTSGGSEANNLALKGTFFALREKGDHIVTQVTEHPAVLKPLAFLEGLGAKVTYLPVDGLDVDLLSIAGHKLYAPKGVGALYVRDGATIEPLLHGAGHESGRRAGTESVLLAAALGEACKVALDWIGMPRVQRLRDVFWSDLREAFGNRVVLNGHPSERLSIR
jgi:cysteine sulfinate desulfinase/cysteine desulfurase-like protein